MKKKPGQHTECKLGEYYSGMMPSNHSDLAFFCHFSNTGATLQYTVKSILVPDTLLFGKMNVWSISWISVPQYILSLQRVAKGRWPRHHKVACPVITWSITWWVVFIVFDSYLSSRFFILVPASICSFFLCQLMSWIFLRMSCSWFWADSSILTRISLVDFHTVEPYSCNNSRFWILRAQQNMKDPNKY